MKVLTVEQFDQVILRCNSLGASVLMKAQDIPDADFAAMQQALAREKFCRDHKVEVVQYDPDEDVWQAWAKGSSKRFVRAVGRTEAIAGLMQACDDEIHAMCAFDAAHAADQEARNP